jgi:inorganic pyrophosphatase
MHLPDSEIDVRIEISKHTNIKYEFEQNNVLRCDRVLHTPFEYIFNYGFVPNTWSLDNDPLDVIVLMSEPLIPGCMIKCKIVACLQTTDDDGEDPKLIAFPIEKVDPTYKDIYDLNDIDEHTLNKIRYFFQHYKDLENKTVDVGTLLPLDKSLIIYRESLRRFAEKKKNELRIAS